MVRIEDLDSLEKALTAGLSANRAELERLKLDAEWAKGPGPLAEAMVNGVWDHL